MMYNKIVEDCFFHPQHVGVLNVTEPGTVSFSTGQEVVIELYMHCDEDYTVCSMCFKSNGNPYVIASLEWLCRQSIGKKTDHLHFNHEEFIKILEIPFNQVPVVMQVEDVYKEILSLMNKKLEGES